MRDFPRFQGPVGMLSEATQVGEMVCVESAAEPSFGQHQAIAGALLNRKEDGKIRFLSGLLPLTWGGGRLLLHSLWQGLSATFCCSLAGGKGGSGS